MSDDGIELVRTPDGGYATPDGRFQIQRNRGRTCGPSHWWAITDTTMKLGRPFVAMSNLRLVREWIAQWSEQGPETSREFARGFSSSSLGEEWFRKARIVLEAGK